MPASIHRRHETTLAGKDGPARARPTSLETQRTAGAIMRMIPISSGAFADAASDSGVRTSRVRKNRLDAAGTPGAPRPLRLSAIERRSARATRQGDDNGIDPAWLLDQMPSLQCLNPFRTGLAAASASLVIVEVQQFESPTGQGIDGYPDHVKAELERLELQPTKVVHFGRDPELPSQDTLGVQQTRGLATKF